jgi:CrcB protein
VTSPRLLVAVAAGGMVGALLRWGLGEVLPDGPGFPWTTFAVNVSGTFVLACLPAFAVVRRSELVDAALGPGLLGGYTTMSAYAAQTRGLVADGQSTIAMAYVVGTLAACVVAALLGRLVAATGPAHPEEHW